MICYVDSSVVLRFLLVHDSAFKQASQYDLVGSSELLNIECNRVLHRYRLEKQISDSELADLKQNLQRIADGLTIIELNQPVKTRAAESFPTVVGTLDALHLASLLLWRDATPEETFILLSADQQMRTCAVALGIQLIE